MHSQDNLFYCEAAALEHAVLPDLSSLLPGWFSLSESKSPLQAAAYQYDHLNYTQLREGLPYLENAGKLFPEARYGLKKISKVF